MQFDILSFLKIHDNYTRDNFNNILYLSCEFKHILVFIAIIYTSEKILADSFLTDTEIKVGYEF